MYVTYFGLIAKPAWSLYAYVLIWMTVPKAFRLYYITGGLYDLPEGMTVFHILELISVCGIVVALIRHRKKRPQLEKSESLKRFTWFFLCTGLISLVISFGFLALFFPMMRLTNLWNFINLHSELQYRILAITSMAYGVIFVYGCVAFINELKQVEVFLLLFLLLGMAMGCESGLFYYLPLISSSYSLFPSLAGWSVNQATERFMSLIFTNIDQVGLFSIIAAGSAMYFALSRKKSLLVLLPIVLMPVFAGYQRSVLLGVLTTWMFLYWNSTTGKKRVVYVCLAVVFLAGMYMVDSDLLLINNIASELGGHTRLDYFSSETLDVRFGLQLRAIELFLYSFPFGVGPGMAATAMNSPIRESMLGFAFPQVGDFSTAVYGQVATGIKTTNPHNFFIEFTVENGLLGILVLAMFLFLLLRNFRDWLVAGRGSSSRDHRLFLVQACVYSVLFGIGMHETFESTAFPYGIYFMFFYFTFLIPKLRRENVAKIDTPPRVAMPALSGRW